jgi:hypothetical protein
MLIKDIDTNIYYYYFKGNNYPHKLRYERYSNLICKCFLDNMYTNLTKKKEFHIERSQVCVKRLT